MPISTFNGLNIALSAVQAEQRSLDTTSHNIANASTDGYSRQVSELAAKPGLGALSVWGMIIPGQLGQGVEVADVTRIRDMYNDNNLRANYATQGEADVRQTTWQGIESSLPEPGSNGLQAAMSSFWTAVQNVSTNPEDTGARQALAQSAQALGLSFQTASNALSAAARRRRHAGQRDGRPGQRRRDADRAPEHRDRQAPGRRPEPERPARPARQARRRAVDARQHDDDARRERRRHRQVRRRRDRRPEHRDGPAGDDPDARDVQPRLPGDPGRRGRSHRRPAQGPARRVLDDAEPRRRRLDPRQARPARDLDPRRGQRPARGRLRQDRHRRRPLLRRGDDHRGLAARGQPRDRRRTPR